MSDINVKEFRQIAVKIAGETAGLLRDIRDEPSSVKRVEPGRETIVADKVAEDYIIELLRSEGFQGLIVSEESGVSKLGEGNMVAVIDPLDGSSNYIQGIPWCAVSVGFAKKTQKSTLEDVVAGAIQPLYQYTCYSFSLLEGVFVGGQKYTREEALKAYEEYGKKTYAVYCESKETLRVLLKMLESRESEGIRIRSLGSASLELALTALGKIGVFIDSRSKLRCIDVAVGLGMIRVLGGAYTGINGEPVITSVETVSRIRSLVASIREEGVSKVVSMHKSLSL